MFRKYWLPREFYDSEAIFASQDLGCFQVRKNKKRVQNQQRAFSLL